MSFKPCAGEVFLNKYEIVSLVGEGAFGSVYRARDIKLDRIVAIKFINIVNDVLERFNDELEAIKGLDHPNIVRLYDFDILKNGMPCMVMEYINGREVGDVLCSDGPFDLQRICEIALQVLDALVETHKHGIVHCDLKPENIMLSSVGARTDVVKLIDFGVASIFSKTSDPKRAKVLVGTPQYMAPEQIRHEEIGPWTDIYAMGLILIELFTGQFVFDSEDPREVLRMQLHKPVILPPKLANTELGPIIARAVEKDKNRRYQSTKAFYDDLKEASLSILTLNRQQPGKHERVHSMHLRSRASQSIFEDFEDFYDSNEQTSFDPVGTVEALERGAGLNQVPLLGHSAGGSHSNMSLVSENARKEARQSQQNKRVSGQNKRVSAQREENYESLEFGSINSALQSLTDLSNSEPEAKPEPEPAPSAEAPAEAKQTSVPLLAPAPAPVPVAKLARQIEISSVSADLGQQTVDNKRTVRQSNEHKKVSKSGKKDRVLVIVAVLVLLVCGVGFFLIRSGHLLIFNETPVQTRVVDEPKKETKQPVVLFASIRMAGETMARTAHHAMIVGSALNHKKIKNYRVIGTPTDAPIYIDNSPACISTPCNIHVLNPEKASIEIRKGNESTSAPLKNYKPDETIFLVLGKN